MMHKDNLEDLTQRITTETSNLINMLKPLELSVNIDNNVKLTKLLSDRERNNRRCEILATESPVNQQESIDELGHLNHQREAQVDNQRARCMVAADNGPEIEKTDQGELQLLWNPDGTIKLEITTLERQEGAPVCVARRPIELSAKTTRLIPLYAESNKESPLSLRIYDGSMSADLHFFRLKDLLRLQQAATGYKVYDAYSQGPVDVILQFSGRERSTMRKAIIQFWIPERLEEGKEENKNVFLVGASISDARPRKDSAALIKHLSISSSSGSTAASSSSGNDTDGFGYGPTQSPTSPFSTSPPYSPTKSRIDSECFPSSSSKNAALTEQAVPSERLTGIGSSWGRRASSVILTGSSPGAGTTRRQSMREGASTQARGQVHVEPRRPMIVLIMHDSSPSKIGDVFSIITVEVDSETMLGPNRCVCQRNGRDECPHVIIERPTNSKHLLAQRYDVRSLEDWDITLPGTRKRKDYPAKELEKLITLRSVSITLAEPGDPEGPKMKKRFAGHKCDCRDPYRTLGEMEHCLKKRHRGNFGIIKGLAEFYARDALAGRIAQQPIQVRTPTTQTGGRR
jgi:hypothetical protein